MDASSSRSRSSGLQQSPTSQKKPQRQMVQAELMGSHWHETSCGRKVYVWMRDGKYLARGRYEGEAFGEDLGADPKLAASRLRKILLDIENGCFVRASRRPHRMLRQGTPQLTARQLCDEFLSEKRRVRGKQTTRAYLNRLTPLIEFAEQDASRRKWPLAASVDRAFALGLRTFIQARVVTRNGRASATPKSISPGQIYNVLDTARSLFNWARRPDVSKLPSTFLNPFTPEIVGQKPAKDPLRRSKLPMPVRIQMVEQMDTWQLCTLVLPMLLPLRPEEFEGLLISDVDFKYGAVRLGTRFGGRDFTKGRHSFCCPFPPEVLSLLCRCIGGRSEGPLLQKRRVFEGKQKTRLVVNSLDEIAALLDQAIASAPRNSIQTDHDAKRVFRGLLPKMGGLSSGGLSDEVKGTLATLGIAEGIRPYDLRESISTELEGAGVSHLVQRYVTGHSTTDIMNAYVALDPPQQMQRYFALVRPLLEAITARANVLGLV